MEQVAVSLLGDQKTRLATQRHSMGFTYGKPIAQHSTYIILGHYKAPRRKQIKITQHKQTGGKANWGKP